MGVDVDIVELGASPIKAGGWTGAEVSAGSMIEDVVELAVTGGVEEVPKAGTEVTLEAGAEADDGASEAWEVGALADFPAPFLCAFFAASFAACAAFARPAVVRRRVEPVEAASCDVPPPLAELDGGSAALGEVVLLDERVAGAMSSRKERPRSAGGRVLRKKRKAPWLYRRRLTSSTRSARGKVGG